ncbi:MAG TPA: ATP-binding protein, partial [Allocoleopsis sp.]
DDSWIIQSETAETTSDIILGGNPEDLPLDDSWIMQSEIAESTSDILGENQDDLPLDNSWIIPESNNVVQEISETDENVALDNSWIIHVDDTPQKVLSENLALDNSSIINVDHPLQKVLKEDDLTSLIPLDYDILTEKQSPPNTPIIPLNLEDQIANGNDQLEDIFADIESPLLSGEEQFIPLDLSQNVLSSEQDQEVKEIIDINLLEKSSNNQELISLENVFGEFNFTQEKNAEIIPIHPSDHKSLSLEDVFAEFTENEEQPGEIDPDKTELMTLQPLDKKQIVEEKNERIVKKPLPIVEQKTPTEVKEQKTETMAKKPIVEQKTPQTMAKKPITEEKTLPQVKEQKTEIVTPTVKKPMMEEKTLPQVKEQKTEIITPTVKKPITEEKTQPKVKETAKETEIKQVVKSIEKAFSSLPVAENITPPKLTNETAKVSENKPAEKPNEPSNLAPQLSVRVDLERLERMNNLVGELAINRNGLSLQNEQLQATVKELLKRFNKFGDIASQLRILSDQMVVETKQQSLPQKTVEKVTEITEEELIIGSFDDLEMDSYGALNSLLQYTLEEVVQLEEIVGDVGLLATQSTQTIESQRQKLNHLRDDLMWARMLPLGEVLSRFPRTLRELSNNYKKPVDLKLVGTGVLVDKAALEKLYDPLLHLLRNAFDHGIETPEIRKTQGKSERGQIEIKAYHQGSQTVIEMRDDGQGINLERIRKKAVESKLMTLEDAAKTSTSKLLDLLFEPGFSTANKVSELSGRGVGLDVVRSQLRSLKGTVSVSSTPGKGTTFTMRIPLTLTIAKLLVCLVKSSAFALPSDSIEEIIIPQKEQINIHNQQRFLQWRKKIVPIYNLANLINYSVPLPDSLPSQALVAIPTPENWLPPILLIRQDHNFLALEMDRLVTEQELVIKSFGSVLSPPNYIYGCTILGDGTLVPVIDTITLINNVMGESKHQLYSNAKSETITSINESENLPLTPNIPEQFVKKINQSPLILVVDDSITLRQTLALTLQKANYTVVQARDGREAISQLQQN